MTVQHCVSDITHKEGSPRCYYGKLLCHHSWQKLPRKWPRQAISIHLTWQLKSSNSRDWLSGNICPIIWSRVPNWTISVSMNSEKKCFSKIKDRYCIWNLFKKSNFAITNILLIVGSLLSVFKEELLLIGHFLSFIFFLIRDKGGKSSTKEVEFLFYSMSCPTELGIFDCEVDSWKQSFNFCGMVSTKGFQMTSPKSVAEVTSVSCRETGEWEIEIHKL